jgi:spore maturation protein CgeB
MADALRRLGHDVTPFAWHTYSGHRAAAGGPVSLLRRAQNKYLLGPVLDRINHDLIELSAAEQPDLLFVYRGTHVLAGSLRQIRSRSPRTLIVGYNNDDPFVPGQARWPWRHFLAAIPEYDCVLAYRPHNTRELEAAGARSTGLLLPWFVPSVHRPIELTAEERAAYSCDVVFIGHFEPDSRLAGLEALAGSGVHLRLFGPGRGYRGHDWDGVLATSSALRHLAPVHEVWDDDYVKAMCGARIALCFFSKRNRDVYTRRCFEIPATGTMMLSEYSPELAEMFREGVEADYFRSPGELAEKAGYYLRNDSARAAVAARGQQRAYAGGHDVDSRMRVMIERLEGTVPRQKAV